MRGDENQLHTADEIRTRHHHERRVAERDFRRDASRGIGDLVGPPWRQRNLVDLAGEPGGGKHGQRQHHKTDQPCSPAIALIQHLPQWRRQQRAERSRRRDDTQYRAPHRRRHRARSEEHTSELQSLAYLVCRLLLEKKKRPYTSERTYELLAVIKSANDKIDGR